MRSDRKHPTRTPLWIPPQRRPERDRYAPRRRADVSPWRSLLDPLTIVSSVAFALFVALGIVLLYAWFS